MFNSSSIEDVPRQQTIIGIRFGIWLALVLTTLVWSPDPGAEEPYPDPANEMWLEVRDSDDPALLRSFMETFPDSPYAHTARLRLERLKFGGGEMCDGKPRGSTCWLELENQPGCYLWVSRLRVNDAATWSGECMDELAEGSGEIKWVWGGNRDESSTDSGQLLRGKKQGTWVERYFNGDVNEGSYVDGKKAGFWTFRYANGSVQDGNFVDGKRHGVWVERHYWGSVEQGPYVKGKRHGLWTVSTKDGYTSWGPYKNGKMHGRWSTQSPSGFTNETTYVNGEEQ